MTVEEAKAAIALAPMDDKPSRVKSGMTRRQVTAIVCEALNKLHPAVIDITPKNAAFIASVVQDCEDPVELRFLYDPHRIVVGWNREEVAIRRGEKPRPATMMPRLASDHVFVDGMVKQPAPKKLDEPKPETKPDPSSPKFVLKRPKP